MCNDQCRDFKYSGERFADIQILRYRLNGFEKLTLKQKLYVYYLSEATLCGRDITTDQFGKYNLRIRKLLETIYTEYVGNREHADFKALVVYLKRIWFSNGIYHHYGYEKLEPGFSEDYLREIVRGINPDHLPLRGGETVEKMCAELFPVIFRKDILPKRVNKANGEDLVMTSACNYYEGVSQQEAEDFYSSMKVPSDNTPPSFGLNSKLVKENGRLKELPWTANGLYGSAIRRIVYWLEKASTVAENDQQKKVISLLVDYYRTGDLRTFDQYSIEWLKELDGQIDFINGFIEVYGDPLGIKASWEGLVEYKDCDAARRTQAISQNAQWFEDHSPVDPQFKKPKVKGVTANAICAAMLGGDEYPSTAIGINLPNADWIRAEHGSKSITITNITDAYTKASRGSGFLEEFVINGQIRTIIEKYGDICDTLHTDLHECLGHGSGQLLPGVDSGALKSYGNTIEEARADLFALYYLADRKLLDLGLLSDRQAYRSHYYSYMLNGLMTQLVRIESGHQLEESHMRNRALIARWTYEHSKGVVSLVRHNGKTQLLIHDYEQLRGIFAQLLAEIQRIKSEGDFEAARELVERYAVNVDPILHAEVLDRYAKLNISPYKGFLNPWLKPVRNDNNDIVDIEVDYSEEYDEQMLRYSRDYGLSEDKVRRIKQSFRLMMNGVASQSMRNKGIEYKINWGISLTDLQQMAREYDKDYHLAVELWKEDIRECKILATLLMPADQMPKEVVEIWTDQIQSQEMAELASFNLYQHLEYAPDIAFQWMASQDEIRQICAYLILARLFTNGLIPNEREINEYLDQVASVLAPPVNGNANEQDRHPTGLRHAARNSLLRFADIGEEFEKMAKKAVHLVFL